MHDASSFRYQHRRHVLTRELRECETQIAGARQLLQDMDERPIPSGETFHAMLTRVAQRGSVVTIIEALEQRATNLQIGRGALEAELRAIWSL